MKFALLCSTFALFASVVDAATKVAVVELGSGGVVRRTTSNNDVTVGGVRSFWSALHSAKRTLQYGDMPMVPDIFQKADLGVIVGISGSGVDLDALPRIADLCSKEGENGVVGHMEIQGSHLDEMMEKLPKVQTVGVSDFKSAVQQVGSTTGLSSFRTFVDSSSASTIDSQVSEVLELLGQEATKEGKTIVVHLVVEEEESSARRHALKRRLEGDDEDRDEDREEENNKEGENEEEAEDGNGNNRQQYNGYYGYGYYNSQGEWVSNYKTIFQIQYFNVVLWTSVGLVIVLLYTVYLMMYMPLMPDTLLFGESAKLVGDE